MKLALTLAGVIASVPGNGGKDCFVAEVDTKSAQIPGGHKVYRVRFLDDVFAKRFPGVFPPQVEYMSGFIRGYQHAMKRAKA